jgi:type III secretion protein R
MQESAGAGGSPIVTIVALGALTILPFVFMTTTSFVKISVVFSILRNALGTGQIPSGTVITALSAILTLYVMAPVGVEIATATAPAVERIDRRDPLRTTDAVFEAVELGIAPLRDFLVRNTGPRERAMFLELAREARPAEQRDAVGDRDLLVIAPAFVVTELSEAFQIGFLVFIPFLIVDLVIANVLLALGMHMLNPTQVSMPFKLLLFVLVDGWFLLARALVLGYV